MTETAPDYDEIVRVIQLYVDGFNEGDIGKCREAFHEDAWIFYNDADGVAHKGLLADENRGYPTWAGRPPALIDGRIISVTQAGDVASVLLGFDDLSDLSDSSHRHAQSWVDLHALLRINGVWKITNKTATHATRAAWAADRQNDQRRESTLA